jgi:GTP-binding protein EngB required for normal cell division
MSEKYLVFTGRPNSGKSSIIREITGLDATIGKHPGTTRSILKYPLSDDLVLVDMPGYGRMMGISNRSAGQMLNRIIDFLESNAQNIALAVHVLDVSTFHEVTRRLEKKGFISLDVEMVGFHAKTLGEFPLVAANKIDKADKKKIEANIEEFVHLTSDGQSSNISDRIYPVSAKTGEGLGSLKNAIHEKLQAKGYRTPLKTQ